MTAHNMTPHTPQSYRLLDRANENRCKHCPPDRVCAWDCVQGAGYEDIVIGAVLEQSQSWALEQSESAPDANRQALWDMYNA
jgi:hypothetical protein